MIWIRELHVRGARTIKIVFNTGLSNFVCLIILYYGRMDMIVAIMSRYFEQFHWNFHKVETFYHLVLWDSWKTIKKFSWQKKNNNCFMTVHNKKKVFIKCPEKRKKNKMKIIWMKTSGKINKTKMGKMAANNFLKHTKLPGSY